MIEQHVKKLLEDVPALKPIKLIVGIDLQGRGDLQQFRLELPAVEVKRDMASDARVRVEMRREFFNAMVEHGAGPRDWRMAFLEGRAKATGVQQYLQLIERVVDKSEERARLRKASH
ncbi:MAG TPA: hypothetical protein VNT22_09510 [Baekduia sp.]|nr:hypothetical protein [Baekduia sp.]